MTSHDWPMIVVLSCVAVAALVVLAFVALRVYEAVTWRRENRHL